MNDLGDAILAVMLVIGAGTEGFIAVRSWLGSRRAAARLAWCLPASGIVEGIEATGESGTHALVRFVDATGAQRVSRSVSLRYKSWPGPGDAVELRYDPNEPGWISVAGMLSPARQRRRTSIFYGVMSLVSIGIVVALLVFPGQP
jgi:hypothetical protein